MLCTSAFTDGVVCATTGRNRRNERRHCGVVVRRLTPLLRRAVDVCGGQVDEEPAQVGARPASGREHDDRQADLPQLVNRPADLDPGRSTDLPQPVDRPADVDPGWTVDLPQLVDRPADLDPGRSVDLPRGPSR